MSVRAEQDGYFLSSKEMLAIRRREYHYNAWSSTLLDPYLQPFWRLTVSYVPTYVTASTLSLCGFVCNVIATGITASFAPTLTETLPRWVSIMNAVSIFVYQTFDGIDGKQCFRNQNCEVEEYADHAADSISVLLNAILLAAALQLGESPFLLGANLTLVLSAFYATHWAAHRTHSLVFGRIDVSEAQLCMIGIHIATAVGGPEIWSAVIFQQPLVTLGQAVCISSAMTLLFGTITNMSTVMGLSMTPLERNGIEIPRRPFSLRPFTTYIVIVASFFLCVRSGLLERLTIHLMLIVGLSLGKASTRMILQKLSNHDGRLYDASMLAPLVLYTLWYNFRDQKRHLHTSSSILVAIVAVDVVIFHLHAFSDLKHARNVNVFSIVESPGRTLPKDTGFYVAGDNLGSVQKAWKEFAKDEKRVKATYFVSAH